MDEFDAHKMLDLYIHDYLLRKNLHITADSLAQETSIQPKSVAVNPPEGFLSEWWSIFWDAYCSRTGINPSGQQASTSTPPLPFQPPQSPLLFQTPQPPQASAPVPQNAHPVSAATNVTSMLPNICAPMIGPTTMPRPELGNFASVVPPRTIDSTVNARNVEQFSRMQPSGSSSGSRKRRANNRQQSLLNQGVNSGTGVWRPTTSELASPVPKLITGRVEQADAGSSASSNSSCPDASS